MKKYIIPLSIVAATFAASCSSDENVNESNKIKDFPIELSLTGDGINTNVTSTDNILTLSTCYSNSDKMVVHAKLIKKGQK